MNLRTRVRAAHQGGEVIGRTDRSERGDTLIEVLMTLVVLSITVLGIIVAFSTAISASVDHRGLAANDVVLRSATEAAIYQLQQQSNPAYVSCATLPANYGSLNFGLPTTGTAYTAAITAIQYWSDSSASFVASPCTPNEPELLTLTVTNSTTNAHVSTSFVIDARGQYNPSALSVTGASPSSLGQGATQNLSITGTGFTSGSTVSFSGTGVTANNATITVSSSTALVVSVSVSNSAPTGTRTITVTNSNGSATSGAIFMVTGALSVTSVSPSTMLQGASNQTITLTGTGFVSGTTVSISGAGVTVDNTSTNVTSSTTMSVNVSVANAAPPGTRTITVNNPGGATATSGSIFTVAAAPSTVLDVNLMIGSYDGSSKQAWDAIVTIDVADSNDNAISGVTVTGTWDYNQTTYTSTCTTNVTGSCKVEDGVSLNLGASNHSVTFTVSNLSLTGYTYNAPGNFANPASAKVSQP